MPISEVTHENNMQMMSRFDDKFFDYALVDPPYGIGIDGQKKTFNKNPKHRRKQHDFKGWDNEIPNGNYFTEVKRVSKFQIIFGGNYFTDFLEPVKSWLIWYKGQQDLTMSDAEMIWTNLDIVTRVITINRAELIKQNTFHPTEKPYKIYRYIMTKFLNPNSKILDTHLGSGSSRIAAYDLGFDFYGCELDKDYFDAQEKRFSTHLLQTKLFTPQQLHSEQIKLL